MEVGRSAEVDIEGFFHEIMDSGVWRNYVKTSSKDMFEFGETRIVHGSNGVVVEIMVELGDLVAWDWSAQEIC